jgi:hypothetical protein
MGEKKKVKSIQDDDDDWGEPKGRCVKHVLFFRKKKKGKPEKVKSIQPKGRCVKHERKQKEKTEKVKSLSRTTTSGWAQGQLLYTHIHTHTHTHTHTHMHMAVVGLAAGAVGADL